MKKENGAGPPARLGHRAALRVVLARRSCERPGDVIYDLNDGVPENLVIVDYKTSTGGGVEPLQLQVYADAGRRDGLTVSAAYIHDMSTTRRHQVPIGDRDV